MIGVLSFKLLCVSPSPRSSFAFFSSASLPLRVLLFCFILLCASASPRSAYVHYSSAPLRLSVHLFFLSASLRLRVHLLLFSPPPLSLSAFCFLFHSSLRLSDSAFCFFCFILLCASATPRSSLFQLTVEHDQVRSDRRPAALPHHCRDLSAVIRGVTHQMLQ